MTFQNHELVFYWATETYIEEDVKSIIEKEYNMIDCNIDVQKYKKVEDEYLSLRPLSFSKCKQFSEFLQIKPVQLLAFLFSIDAGRQKQIYYNVNKIQGPPVQIHENEAVKVKTKNVKVHTVIYCDDVEKKTFLHNMYGTFSFDGYGTLITIPNQEYSLETLLFRLHSKTLELLIATTRKISVFQTIDLEYEPDFSQVYKINQRYVFLYGKLNENGEETDSICFEFKLEQFDNQFLFDIEEEIVDEFRNEHKHSLYDMQSNTLTLVKQKDIYEFDWKVCEKQDDILCVFGNAETMFTVSKNGELKMNNNEKIMNVHKNCISFCCLYLK